MSRSLRFYSNVRLTSQRYSNPKHGHAGLSIVQRHNFLLLLKLVEISLNPIWSGWISNLGNCRFYELVDSRGCKKIQKCGQDNSAINIWICSLLQKFDLGWDLWPCWLICCYLQSQFQACHFFFFTIRKRMGMLFDLINVYAVLPNGMDCQFGNSI